MQLIMKFYYCNEFPKTSIFNLDNFSPNKKYWNEPDVYHTMILTNEEVVKQRVCFEESVEGEQSRNER